MPSEPDAPGAPIGGGAVPLSVPNLSGNEWKYLKDCLDTGWVSTAGPYVDRFEAEFARRLGVEQSASMSSGTAALHVALLAAGVQADDEVLVSSLTFIAPVNAVRYAGAHPVLVDADPDYWQMDVELVADFLENRCELREGVCYNRLSGRRVAAVVPVHILGHPVDMGRLLPLAQAHGLKVVEDATESLGGTFQGRPLGTLGDFGCFSFNGNKLMTTGGGGMVVARRGGDLQRCAYLSTQAKDDPLEYVHRAVGFNYRLTNLQAAIGVAQLEQLDSFLEAKRRTADRYRETLGGLRGLTLPAQAPWAGHAQWLFTVLIDAGAFGMSSRALMDRLAERGVQTRPLWTPAHRQPIYADATILQGAVSERLHSEALSLPCSTGITPAELERVCGAIRELARQPSARS